MKDEMNSVIGLLGNFCLPAGREAYLEVGVWWLESSRLREKLLFLGLLKKCPNVRLPKS
jgi:hypothetical protein